MPGNHDHSGVDEANQLHPSGLYGGSNHLLSPEPGQDGKVDAPQDSYDAPYGQRNS
jgi:hypothetical protein